MDQLRKRKSTKGKCDDVLDNTSIIEITVNFYGSPSVSRFVLLDWKKESSTSFMDDGYHYNCIVMNEQGQVHFCILHEKEILDIPWFSSRAVKFF